MEESKKTRFKTAISDSFVAFDKKEQNIELILGVLREIRSVIEDALTNELSLLWQDSQLELVKKVALEYTSGKTNPLYHKPLNQVLYIVSKAHEDIREEWTILEMGVEGFPCTIYVDGNRLTATTIGDLEDNFELLLRSPITAEKFKLVDQRLKDH